MESIPALPYGSVLGPPPKVQFPKPCAFFTKFTKLYVFLTMFSCFVDRTATYELKVHGLPNREHLNNTSSDSTESHYQDPRQDAQGTNVDDHTSQTSETASPTQATTTPTPRPAKSSRRNTPLNMTSGHLEDMLNGIAQDIFHHPTEQNFYESNWQSEFGVWAANPDVQRKFSSMVNARATARLKERDGESSVPIEGPHTRQPRPTPPFQPRSEGGSCVTAYFPEGNPKWTEICPPKPTPTVQPQSEGDPNVSTEWPHTRQLKPTPTPLVSQPQSPLDLFGFYALDVLGWKHMRCSAELGGCEGMPSPEYIRSKFPSDPHRARQFIYTIDSFRKMYVELHTYQDVLQSAKTQVQGYCMDFAATFFHKDTEPEKKMCVAQIIQIIMGIITAIVAIVTVGQLLYAMAPALSAGVASLASSESIASLASTSLTSVAGSSAARIIELMPTISRITFQLAGPGRFPNLGVLPTIFEGVAYEVPLEVAQGFGVAHTISIGRSSVLPAMGLRPSRDVLGSESGVIISAGDAAGRAAAHDFEVSAGIASSSNNLDMVSGACSGVVGLTAMSDTAFAAFEGTSNWTVQLSVLTDDELATKISEFDHIFQDVAHRVTELMSNIIENGRTGSVMPKWSKFTLSSAELSHILQQSALRTRNLMGQSKHIWFVETGKRVLSKKIPQWAIAAAGNMTVTEDSSNEISVWMQTALEDAILIGYGQALEAKDLSTFVKKQKANYENRQGALKQTLRTAMGALTRHMDDTSPVPKEWGSFALLEWFPIGNLSFDPRGETPLYKQVEVQSRTFFKKYPETANAAGWKRKGQPSFMGDSTHITDKDLDQDSVVRLTKLFTLLELETAKNATTLNVDSSLNLGARITLRMQDGNRQALTAPQAWEFWETHSDEIHRRVQMLRQHKYNLTDTSIARFVPLKVPTTLVQVAAQTSLDTMSWASVLGTVDFEGYTTTGAANFNVPELRWRTKPSAAIKTRLGRRQAHKVMDSVAVHEIRGKLNTLESLGLVAAGSKRRVKRDMPLYTRETESGQVFVAEVNEQLFQSGIKNDPCGNQYFHTDRINSEGRCKSFLTNVVDQINEKFHSMAVVKDSGPVESAAKIGLRFSTYEAFTAADARALKKDDLQKRLQENLKNSLVTKAYADQNCYLMCKPGTRVSGSRQKVYDHYGKTVSCISGCFDPIDRKLDRLYGFDERKADKSPWDLNESRINDISWHAYERRDYTGYLPGRVDLNPFADHIKEHTPILPVCYTEMDNMFAPDNSGLLCNCGDKYGNETEMVINAARWTARGYKAEHEQFGKCIERLKYRVKPDPAAFLVNMCNAYYKQLVPPGMGTHSEKKNKGSYKDNLKMCQQIWSDYGTWHGHGDGTLNYNICKTWRRMSKNHHADGQHADFSWVNSVVRHSKRCGKHGHDV